MIRDKLRELEERMKRYEEFTRRFMEATPEELEELGRQIFMKRLREADEEFKASMKEEMEKADKAKGEGTATVGVHVQHIQPTLGTVLQHKTIYCKVYSFG